MWVEKDAVLSIFSASELNEFSTRPAKERSYEELGYGAISVYEHPPTTGKV